MDGADRPRFGTLITAMVTPFDEEGALDLDAAAMLARWLVDHGSDGLVVAGTTGEGPTLSEAEKGALWRCLKESVTVPIVAGVGSNDTAHSIEMAKAATDAGVDGLLVVTPYYNRPPQEGIRLHMAAVASATHLPVMIYDIPIRTGRRVANETMAWLAHHVANIVAVKNSVTDVADAARLATMVPSSFEIYSGEDDLALAMMAVGAVGLVSVASHWAGREIAGMLAAHLKGDVTGARDINSRLAPSFAFESTERYPNPMPAKAACRLLGLAVGECRLPLAPGTPELDELARRVLEGLGTTVG
jgi:4-hydroxy-tetrahydrodipicolinate synthase